MQSPRRVVAAATVVVAALAACGPSGASHSARPGDAVLAAAQSISGQSLRYDVDLTVGVDTSGASGLPKAALQFLGPASSGVHITASVEQESASRLRMTVSAAPLLSKPATVVLYDGDAYVSTDGTHFKQLPKRHAGASGSAQLSPDTVQRALTALGGDVADKGQEQKDGVTTERYEATLTKDSLGRLFQALTTSASASSSSSSSSSSDGRAVLGALLLQLIDVRHGVADAWVRTDNGGLDRVSIDLSLGVDLGRAAGALAGLGKQGAAAPAVAGTVVVTLQGSTHLHDQGSDIRVARPAADASASDVALGPAGGLFGVPG